MPLTSVADRADPRVRRASVVRFLAVAVAGVAMGLSWEPYGWWPLLAVGLPLFTLAVRAQRGRRSFALGYVFGLVMLTVTISWLHVLGVWIAALLIVFEALFFGLLGVALSLVGRLRWWPVAAACGWVLVELGYSSLPFGGFGWARIAYAAVDTPLAGFLPLVGVAGVSFLVALVGQLVAWAALVLTGRHTPRTGRTRPVPRARSGLAALLALGLLLGGGALLRHWDTDPTATAAGSVNVGIVQGNVPGRGIAALGRARTVTNNHLAETVRLMDRVRAGELGEPDFVLWPENSTDIDPLRDAQTRQTVQTAATVAGRPILVGAVTEGPGVDERQTTALWWDPQQGPVATYHKQNLVPFGEWIPFRAQLLPYIPILQEVGAQSIPGTGPGVLDVQAGGHPLRVGDVICFELAYDQTVYRSITAGAQISVVQSNNATYGGTGQIEQQFAITRARAMESRREIAVATTDSVSGYIGRDGTVLHKTAQFTAASTVVSMPLRNGLTPALVAGPWIARGLAAVGLLACLAGLVVGRRRTTRGGRLRAGETTGSPVSKDEGQAAPMAGPARGPVPEPHDRERLRVD